MAKVLVTGASGKAGRYIVDALAARGHSIRGTYRTQPGTADIEWRQADLTHTDDLRALMADCDAVLHFAGELSKRALMDAINVDVTQRLAAAAQDHGVRYFGHASSIVVYGSPQSRFVDEQTPRLDPHSSIVRQYHAEPYMRDYARTKALGEIAIERIASTMTVDIYRPAVVVEDDQLLQSRHWSIARKICASYRRTQFMPATDTAAAIVHLLERGLAGLPETRAIVEHFNLADAGAQTFRDVMRKAYRVTGNRQFSVPISIPAIADLGGNFARYRGTTLRYPLGMLRISAEKLLATGFVPPTGAEGAVEEAISLMLAGGGQKETRLR